MATRGIWVVKNKKKLRWLWKLRGESPPESLSAQVSNLCGMPVLNQAVGIKLLVKLQQNLHPHRYSLFHQGDNSDFMISNQLSCRPNLLTVGPANL